MINNDSPQLVATLEKAKLELMRSNQAAMTNGQWDRAQFMLQCARDLDGMIIGLRQNGMTPAPVRPAALSSHAPKPRPAKLPYYCVEGDKLVKVGPSRDGTTYEHRVTREHFDLMIGQLSVLATEGKTFETPDLIKRCDVPKHEPLIILAVLEEQKLLINVRRGRWVFVNVVTFQSDAQRVWAALPKR